MENSRYSDASGSINSSNRRQNLEISLKKVREAQVQLEAYENLLKNKEIVLEERSENINQDFDRLKKEKFIYEKKIQDFEEEKRRFCEEKNNFKRKYEKYKAKKVIIIEKDKVISENQKKAEENYKKSEHLKHQLLNKYEILKKNRRKT